MLVSILVLVDVSPEDASRIRYRVTACIVSILVLVDVSPEELDISLTDHGSLVSILVLVDVSPEDDHRIIDRDMNGFNPCSRGCFARRTATECQRLMFGKVVSQVSILVLVDVSPEDRPILALFGCILIKMLEIPA